MQGPTQQQACSKNSLKAASQTTAALPLGHLLDSRDTPIPPTPAAADAFAEQDRDHRVLAGAVVAPQNSCLLPGHLIAPHQQVFTEQQPKQQPHASQSHQKQQKHVPAGLLAAAAAGLAMAEVTCSPAHWHAGLHPGTMQGPAEVVATCMLPDQALASGCGSARDAGCSSARDDGISGGEAAAAWVRREAAKEAAANRCWRNTVGRAALCLRVQCIPAEQPG